MDTTKLKQTASDSATQNAGSKLISTPASKGEKREASSPPIPPEPQPEKKCREGSSTSDDTATSEDDVVDVLDLQQSSSLGASPSLHVFSKPMHPTDIIQIAAELRSMMLPEISAIIKDQTPDIGKIVFEAVKQATSSLVKEVEAVKSENKKMKEANSKLEERVIKLELDNDSLEQYGRRNILRISGIPEKPNEETDDMVLQLAGELNVPMSKYDIDRSHRVGRVDDGRRAGRTTRSKRQHRDIIVKFTSYNARYRLFQMRKELRETENEELKTIYLNEDLTRLRSGILFEARSLKRAKKLNSAYSSDGKLFIRDLTDTRIQISSLGDLVQFGYKKKSSDSGDSAEPQPSTSGARTAAV